MLEHNMRNGRTYRRTLVYHNTSRLKDGRIKILFVTFWVFTFSVSDGISSMFTYTMIYTNKNHKTCIPLLLSVIKIVNKKGSNNTPLNTVIHDNLTLFFLTVYFQHPVESRHFSLLLILDVLLPQQYLITDPVDPLE